ncbi:MAG: DNA polymerase III subunit chi, partial [Rhizomicrobium sp.]
MSEVLFYHLERRSLEDALPALVERTLARGWKAAIRTESAERAGAIDRLLWTYDEESFLPHGLATEPDAARQPVLIGLEDAAVNGADVLFVVGGAAPPVWDGASFVRIVLMFDGRDPMAVQTARTAWKEAKA